MYMQFPAKLADLKCVSSLSQLLTSENVHYFLKEGQSLERREMDGVVTLIGQMGQQRVGIVWTDFRVGGGSFGSENSKRLSAFIKCLERQNLPLIFLINSLGARFMASRTLFDNAFGVLPDLYRFSKNNLFIGVSIGKTLGLSALFFTQAHYRLALKEATQINLTGPEVHRKFFGSVTEVFESYTTAEHQFSENSLIHEIHPSTQSIYEYCRDLILFSFDKEAIPSRAMFNSEETEQGALALVASTNEKLADLRRSLADETFEILESRSSVVKTYIGKMKDGRKIGLFVNPPGHANNLLTVNAIDKCVTALRVFKALKLPVVTVLDCPGGDPRKKESDKDALIKMMQLCHEMIDYPYLKMGIINGRCFGGSGMFTFPKIFGGERVLAVKGSQIGVMHKSIIAELLANSPSLLESWKVFADTETADLADLIQEGIIEAVIERASIRSEIEKFLNQNSEAKSQNVSKIVLQKVK